jgi:hypothetical protein
MVFRMKFQHLDFGVATYPKYDIVSPAMISQCPFNNFNIYSRFAVYNYNCPNKQILLVKHCVEQKFYSKCMPLNLLCQILLWTLEAAAIIL